MQSWGQGRLFVVLIAMVAVGCTPAPAGQARAPGEPSRGSPKRITAAIMGEPYTLSGSANTAGTGSIRGVTEVEQLIHTGLSVLGGDGRLGPVLAEQVATIEDGRWKVFADGRMETSWKIRGNALWQDGVPFTTDDLLFTLQVGQDKDVPLSSYPGYQSLERVEALDSQTITASWRQPFIEADRLFSPTFAIPLPKHILETTYQENKAGLLDLPYWTSEFVGAGPFRVTDFVRGSHMVIAANDGFVLGRPKLDEIAIRFIQDPNTLIANLLAGEVDVTIGRGMNLEQALQAGAQWPDGHVDAKPSNWIAHYTQFLNPNPAVLADPGFRRALLYALDRQGMSDSLQSGQAPIAHAYLEPTSPYYREVESSVVKYEYDPRKAVQLIETLGYIRGPDGFFRDSAGQKLSVESRTNAGDDAKEKMVLVGADYWQRAGVGVDVFIVPRQQASDREFRANYPSFDLVRQPFDPSRYLSSEAALSENRYDGKNRSRYMNGEMDAAIRDWYSTIPVPGRVQALGKILHILSDQAVTLGVFFGPEPMLIANKLVNVSNPSAPEPNETWNGYQWDLR